MLGLAVDLGVQITDVGRSLYIGSFCPAMIPTFFESCAFRYAEGKSKFSEHVLNEGQEMKTIEETISIIHLENNHIKIKTLEEIEILKAASSMISSQDKMTQYINFSPHQ